MQVYFDNSATSWPKPVSVVDKMIDYLINYGANPGKSGHAMSLRAGREVFETRELIADFFNVPSSDRVVFTMNATHALNIILKGFLQNNDHVIISSFEHNCVIRPLRLLEKERNISITIVPCDSKGNIDLIELEKSFRPDTKAVVTLHGSNVTGTILPIYEIGAICKKKNVPYIIDASQTAGLIPIDMIRDNISMLVFTGHKKLYGPPGVGVLCLQREIDVPSYMQGGSGSFSEHEVMPDFLPDKHEAGTKNTVGIVGLKAGIEFIRTRGIENIRREMNDLTRHFIKGISEIGEVKKYGPDSDSERLPVISVNLSGMLQSDVAHRLDKEFGIMVRAGLHCAPLAHKTIGTFPTGTVRFSLGSFNTEEEVSYTIEAIKKIINSGFKS
ncbi:MAG: aminotransferase class V-fold PLP-dependent enzyme [Bacteroidia bacterium]|nr:aminotransferase class V-fold PLP-dependent enzyme [Bacteroidia bacterium]